VILPSFFFSNFVEWDENSKFKNYKIDYDRAKSNLNAIRKEGENLFAVKDKIGFIINIT